MYFFSIAMLVYQRVHGGTILICRTALKLLLDQVRTRPSKGPEKVLLQ